MPSHFTLPHIEISQFKESHSYKSKSPPFGSDKQAPIREEHGRRLKLQLDAAFEAVKTLLPDDERLPQKDSVYLETELRSGAQVSKLEKKNAGVKIAAVKQDNEGKTNATILVPSSAKSTLDSILEDYANAPLTGAGKPPRKDLPEAIQNIFNAELESVWTDASHAPPKHEDGSIWWEVWCWKEEEKEFDTSVDKIAVRAADKDKRLYFSETVVIPVFASRHEIEMLLFRTGTIAELRRASDNASIFIDDMTGSQQHSWTDDFAERTIWPDNDVPSVCLLDTGVNRGHALLEPALSEQDCHAIDIDWGVDDHHPRRGGHGTLMAGTALFGDLAYHLAGQADHRLKHRLESVKILPPQRFDSNAPESYGKITQSAISLAEISNPERNRTFCMAVTGDDASAQTPSTWSAALDQAAYGDMSDGEENAPKRLIVVSGGNIPDEINRDEILDAEYYPIENPAQAWNALTVGAYTDKTEITDQDLENYTPFAEAGDLSPFSRTSSSWLNAKYKMPIKPEIVMEGGNRALSPCGREVYNANSLSLLSTAKEVATEPLAPFMATSAATAQAARLAARLSAEHPELWPETIRGLIVHSAEWTQPMKNLLSSADGKKNIYKAIRRFGYGVPSFERAAFSAQNHLALLTQTSIQPYKYDKGKKFHECHYYNLPWPKEILEDLGNTDIELKITLSYFVDPSPGLSASIDPQYYRSFGLRFDLRRKNETLSMFKKRVNADEREPQQDTTTVSDDGDWVLGPKAISAGSLHCDALKCTAVDLLQRDTLCVYPVNGWWRIRADKSMCNQSCRYALVVTIKTQDTEIDLYTPIQNVIATQIPTEIQSVI